jgi:hypothetical protein
MQHIRSFESSGAGCNCIAFAPSTGGSCRTISAAYTDGVIRQLDLSSAIGANSEAILIHDSPVQILQYAQVSDYLLCGSADGTVSSVCLPKRHVRKVSAVVASGAAVCSLCWSADAPNIWLASTADGNLHVFSIDIYSVLPSSLYTPCLVFHPPSPFLEIFSSALP